MTDAVIEEILSRDYISSTTCDRLAEVCLLRSQRTDGLEEFLLFQTLESLCKQASRYAKNREQADEQEEIEGLRAQLAEYENVIIPSWKREEDGWREDEANAIEFRRVLAEELDKRDADIARLKALLTELLRLLESCTTAEYGYSAKIKAKAAIDAARAADSASAQEEVKP